MNKANILKELFEQNGNPEKVAPMKKYMKNKFEFYGISSPERKLLLREYFKTYDKPSLDELAPFIKTLWSFPHRELHHAACDILRKYKQLNKEHIELLEYLIINNSWWDTVDAIVPSTLGKHFKKYPELIVPRTQKWLKSDNIWLKRSCILFQLKYKKDIDVKLLFNHILQCADEKDFFVRKAIGWVLREYSKTDGEIVEKFITENNAKLSNLSKREGMKYLNS